MIGEIITGIIIYILIMVLFFLYLRNAGGALVDKDSYDVTVYLGKALSILPKPPDSVIGMWKVINHFFIFNYSYLNAVL